MKFKSKENSTNYFWVTDYNKDEKEFFEMLGFKEHTVSKFKTLNFKGSGLFGMWTKKEYNRIVQDICDWFNLDSLTIEQHRMN